MLLHSPMLTHLLPSDFDLYLALYEAGIDLLTITGAWSCLTVMVLVQHLLKRFCTAKAGRQCDEERSGWRCN